MQIIGKRSGNGVNTKKVRFPITTYISFNTFVADLGPVYDILSLWYPIIIILTNFFMPCTK